MIDELVRKHRRKGIVVDTNLLLGYLIGQLHPRYLENCRATTKRFQAADLPLLDRFLGEFDPIVTTPHILTEASNLAGKLPAKLHYEFRKIFRAVVSVMREESTAAGTIVMRPEFIRFGLADAGISKLAEDGYLILTDEDALYGLLTGRGNDAINFGHVKVRHRN